MKLVRQVSLVLDEGRTEKVYEVDLCEVGPDKFVVNFRFGIKGGAIKDGSKTVVPVPEHEATKIFDKLVASKTKKGFYDANDPRPRPAAPPPVATGTSAGSGGGVVPRRRLAFDPDKRKAAILEHLRKKTRWTTGGRSWPLSRVVWRAGELRLSEAADDIAALLDGKTDSMTQYACVWALGRCGNESHGRLLQGVLDDKRATDATRRIAAEALLSIAPPSARAQMQVALKADLPPPLAAVAQSGPADAFAAALTTYLNDAKKLPLEQASKSFAVLNQLYLIDDEVVRPAVLDVIQTAPLRPPYFQRLRHLYKAAEYREDAEVFGRLAHRFAKVAAMFKNDGYTQWKHIDGDYINVKQELKKGDASRLAYSSKTRAYFRRRTARTLRKLGERSVNEKSTAEAYVKMAVGVLLPFTDADAQSTKTSSQYDWSSQRSRITHYDKFANYHAFNTILYANSPRYEHVGGRWSWRCRAGYKPSDAAPHVREEAFPEAWDEVPAGLLHLLVESACEEVHQFAAKALRANDAACKGLPAEAVALLLARPYLVTVRLAFDLAKDRWDSNKPNLVLAAAAANCLLQSARTEAHRWMEAARLAFAQDHDALVSVIASPYADTREAARSIAQSAVLSDVESAALVRALLDKMLRAVPTDPDGHLGDPSKVVAKGIGETLLRAFAAPLRTVDLDVVRVFLSHDVDEVATFGAELLLAHQTRPKDLPTELLEGLLQSKTQGVRAIGIRLFSELPDATLLEREDLLATLCTSALKDVREQVRPVIARLANGTGQEHQAFAADLAVRLVGVLLRKERVEGLHDDLVTLLRDALSSSFGALTEKTIFRLINAPTTSAQDLGGEILRQHVDPSMLSLIKIAKLASHDVKSVRETAQGFFEGDVERVRREIGDAVRILDAKWEDAREWAFAFFRKHFGQDDFSPAVLVAVCDSVRPDVQRFGRDLITRFFDESAGEEYLLKLSEHPTTDLQLFATNYLERYAAGDVEKLRQLEHYFKSVLSRVNRGRVAKARVLAFLRSEAQKSEAAARFVAEILARQSVTIAIGDKAACIDAMVDLKEKDLDLTLPLALVPLSVRAPKRAAVEG